MKKYESKILEILPNGDAIIELPIELCKELNWKSGDELTVQKVYGSIILKKQNGSEPTY